MSDCIKAVPGEVFIGDIPLKVYQYPDGKYRLAGTSVTDAIKEPRNSLLRSFRVKSLKDLPGAESGLLPVTSEAGGKAIIPVSISDALQYWMTKAVNGNQTAAAIVLACAEETIERRADKAFGIVRTEQERDELLGIRVNRIRARLGWTDIIKRDQEGRGVYLTDIGRREFADITRMINWRLFGVYHFECDRDNMTIDQQLDITAFERMLRRKYKDGDDLHDVMRECLDFYQSVEH